MTMQAIAALPRLFASGQELESCEEALGFLRDSTDVLDDAAALRQRMEEEGYLYLPGMLNRHEVLEARELITGRLACQGVLDEAFPAMEAVVKPQAHVSVFQPEVLARNNPALDKVLYAGPMMEFFARFLGGEVRHFDYTWFRSVAPGPGTPCHCDVVYMGRGTPRLYTAWTPIGDVSFDMGGLMILERSQQNRRLRNTYCKMDVDAYCVNKVGREAMDAWGKGTGGHLHANPVQIRRSLGGRWLTSEFRAGDVLLFSVFTVHASLDNRSNRIRLSSDSRYQLASEPADERWIGPNPPGHGQAGKRGRIC